jgi:5-methylcytosine-specific restriction protein A
MKLPENRRRSYEAPKRKAQEGRLVDHKKLYNGRPWRKFRAAYLALNPLCIECTAEELIVAATVVDHIKQVRLGGDFLDVENVQPLCSKHHNRKSGRERWQAKK